MKKYFLITLIVLLVSGFILIGATPSVMAAEKDKYGGILRVATSKAPRAFGYPPKIRGAAQNDAAPVLEFLVLTTRQNETRPHLATGWEISPDGKSFTFKLRKGVKFHDGTDFNAEAAKYNLDLWLKTKGTVLNKMKSVDIVDDHTIRVTFSEFDALIMYELSTSAYIASPTAIEKNGVEWADTHPVGTGPFKLKKYERNVKVSYERFDDYWRKGLPYLDGYERVFIKDPMTQIAVLKAGEVDGIVNLPRENAEMLKKLGYDLTIWYHVNRGMFGDSKNPDSIWSNKKVREAIDYAIDKDALSNELGSGLPKPLYQFGISENPFYNPDLKPRKYDPEKARQLLAEAGYPNGLKTTVSAPGSSWPQSWVAIQGYLAKVGIDLQIDLVNRPKYLKFRFQGALEKNGSSLIVYIAEANYLLSLKNYLMASAPQYQQMARPEGFDDLVKKAVMERDPETRKAFIHQATKLLHDHVTFIPINAEPWIAAVGKHVHDIDFPTYVSPNAESFTRAWMSKK